MTAEEAEQKVLKRLAYIANNELLTQDANNLRVLISEFLSLRNDFRLLKKEYDELKEAWCNVKEDIAKSNLGEWYVGSTDGKSEEVIPTATVYAIIDKYLKGIKNE